MFIILSLGLKGFKKQPFSCKHSIQIKHTLTAAGLDFFYPQIENILIFRSLRLQFIL